MSAIDEIKQRTDIVEVVGQYTTLTKAGRVFKGLCPFHSEKHASFFVYPEQQSWHCFGACNTGGDVFSFVMKKQELEFSEALRILAQRAGVTIPSRSDRDAGKDEKEKLYQANQAASQYFHNLLLNSPAAEKARNYIGKRGLNAKVISDFQLGFSLNSWEGLKQYLLERGYTEPELIEAGLIIAKDDGKTYDRFRNHLMFPISDNRGRTTGFGARVLDDSFPKYVNSPQTPLFDKSSSLYGINLATPAIKQHSRVLIVEGYMDVIIAHQYGFSNVIAAMGTSITEKQISALKRLTRNMVLALDADSAGEEAMLRCVDYENSLDAEVKVIVLPEGKDPDEVIKEDAKNWERLLEQALPVVDYTFDMVKSKSDLATTSGKAQVIDKMLPIIAGVKDNTRRDSYLTRLARLTGTSYTNMETTLRTYLAKKKTQKPKQEAVRIASRPILSSPLEADCLTLLLRHFEFKESPQGILPEYFENSENREIFKAWQQTDDLPALKANLDTAILEHLDAVVNKSLPATINPEQRYDSYLCRLRERYFKNLEARRAEIFSLEVESGGARADLVRLEREGIEPASQLKIIHVQKAREGRR